MRLACTPGTVIPVMPTWDPMSGTGGEARAVTVVGVDIGGTKVAVAQLRRGETGRSLDAQFAGGLSDGDG